MFSAAKVIRPPLIVARLLVIVRGRACRL